MSVPEARIRVLVHQPASAGGRYVLYWMIAQRRLTWNFALDRACGWARQLGLPLLVFEPLEIGYQWASDRLHRFVLDGMADHATALEDRPGVTYLPWVEPRPGAQRGLLAALAADAAVVVTDDYPAFIVPGLLEAAASAVPVRFEAIDANGLLPMRAADRAFQTAYAFRRFLQQTLPQHLPHRPSSDPLADLPAVPAAAVPRSVDERWPSPARALIAGAQGLSALSIDHSVKPVDQRGGRRAAAEALTQFVDTHMHDYGASRNRVENDVTSRLSPYLHFGHISSWEVVDRVLSRDGWIGRTAARATGAREGWWGASPAVEGFLDQIVTWRELGFNMCVQHAGTFDKYETLPAWALATLDKHATDPRMYRYGLPEFEQARTHDPLWNAAQGQLVAEGRIHNYLRMLWGKKILEWTASPREALAVMIELNNRYALDGRDPNSYSGIFWTLGRYDRPWAPERSVFGTVRYMSSENTARKMPVRSYIRRYAPADGQAGAQPALLDLN
jgi:deoxyribodipyrimidine photo-lyase